MKHMIVTRDGVLKQARIVWDDETGTVEGDHSKAPDLAAAIGNGPMPLRRDGSAELADPAHNPADFLTALRIILFLGPKDIELPDSLSGVTPTPIPSRPSDTLWMVGIAGLVILLLFGAGYWALRETDEERIARLAREAENRAQEVEDRRKGFHCLSAWNGSHRDVERRIKGQMRDPGSFEHVETRVTPVSVACRDNPQAAGDCTHSLFMTYRGKNAFGGVVSGTARAKYRNSDCQVVEVEAL